MDYDSLMPEADLTGVSLFSAGGIGDLALRASGVRVLVANELLEDRAQVFMRNFPETAMVVGDIALRLEEIVRFTRGALHGCELDVLFATPPCQGMSKNGRGKLLRGVRDGLRPILDSRNQLILPALKIAQQLRPRLLVFENVPEMQNTLIEYRGKMARIFDVITRELGPEYAGRWEVVEFADYGVPQRRQRLLTVFSRLPSIVERVETGGSLLPPPTHSRKPGLFEKPWVSVDEALKGVPPLDAQAPATALCRDVPFHSVPLLDDEKYFWVSHTPPGRGAFDNQCANPKCGFDGNPTHGASHGRDGINRANSDTPIYCLECGYLLPRPWVRKGAECRLMSGFTSAYKRMPGHLPASALTRNLSYACSDQKLHPVENRVLSLYEAFLIHTVSDFDFRWERMDGEKVSDKSIREMIGESIPPRGLKFIFDHLLAGLRASYAARPKKAARSGEGDRPHCN